MSTGARDESSVSGGVPLWQRWLPRAGAIAAGFTTLCCIGVSAALSLASAVGATFLTKDATLRPVLAATLALTVVGSALTYWRHRNPSRCFSPRRPERGSSCSRSSSSAGPTREATTPWPAWPPPQVTPESQPLTGPWCGRGWRSSSPPRSGMWSGCEGAGFNLRDLHGPGFRRESPKQTIGLRPIPSMSGPRRAWVPPRRRWSGRWATVIAALVDPLVRSLRPAAKLLISNIPDRVSKDGAAMTEREFTAEPAAWPGVISMPAVSQNRLAEHRSSERFSASRDRGKPGTIAGGRGTLVTGHL